MARAGLKTCVSCVVENCDETDWQDITLQVSGEMIDFSEIHLETITAGSRVQIEQLRIEAKKDVLLSSTEATDTMFTLKLSIGGEEQMRQELPIRMLAYEEWAGIGIMPELLAAFVTPNHPLLSRVITEAAKYLERWTGSSSMDAYQTQDRNRVRMQVASIYEALRGEGIVYSEPMASFEQRGQRIRLVDRVLTEKLGTCLDTTVLMASCFEAIGLFPIVVIMEGHAFVGAWLNEQFYSQDVGDDASYLLKQSADGVNNLVLVESTCITSSSPMTFDDAVAAAEKKLRMDQQFRCFIDIRRCRLDNVRPLPVRVLGESGWVLENEGVEHDTATEGIQTFDHYALHLDHAPQQITKQLIWERKLLDFSLRNNLINCRLGRRVIPFVSFGIDKLEDAVFDGNDFSVIPYPKKQIEPTETGMYDSRLQAADLEEMARTEAQDNCRLISYHSQAELDSALKFVYRASRNSLEENGANTLFLVLGMLKWYENEKSVVEAIQTEVKNIESYKLEAEQAERAGDYGKVAELRYGRIKEAEKKVSDLKIQLKQLQADNAMINEEVDSDQVAEVVSRWTGIPVTRMMQSERERLLHLEEELHKRVVGQDEAISTIANAIRRSRTGLSDGRRPIGSFIFLGTTGVGKTELAKALAEVMFDDEDMMVRIDMSEYQERHSVSRLIGAPPGYVGYDESGQLTEAVRRKPYSIVLFDEIEKAHPDVFNILLQVLEDGRLTDNKGRVADFKNTIIIMTSNMGSELIRERLEGNESFTEYELEETKNAVMELLKQKLRPEFLNRIDETIMFRPLTKSQIREVVKIQLNNVSKMLEKNDILISATDEAVDHLADIGYDPAMGARPVKRVIQREILNELSRQILEERIKTSDTIIIDVIDNQFVFYNPKAN